MKTFYTRDKANLALNYHENSKSRHNFPESFNPRTEYKIYTNTEIINLDKIDIWAAKLIADSFHDVLLSRKTTRSFSALGIDLKTLSKLLALSFGLRGDQQNPNFRTYASAGACYPIEVYVVMMDSPDLKKGIYHYNVLDNTLELLKACDYSQKAKEDFKKQKINTFPCLIFFSLVFERTMKKYGERGYRYALLDAGHMGQNLYLVSEYLKLGVVGFGDASAEDWQLDDILGLRHASEDVIYSFAIGHPL